MFKRIKEYSVPIIILFATIFVIAFNLIAAALPLNNVYTNVISDKYFTLFTPTGFIFAIWGLIYVLLGTYAIWCIATYKKNKEIINKSLLVYVAAAALNCIWLVAWHYDYIRFSIIPMLLLLISLMYLYRLYATSTVSRLIRLVFSVYMGWISVATIVNVAILLTLLDWNRFGLNEITWSAIMLFVGVALGLYMLNRFKDKAFYFVIVWAAIGIWINNPEDFYIFAIIFFAIISFLVRGFINYVRKPILSKEA